MTVSDFASTNSYGVLQRSKTATLQPHSLRG